MPSHVCNLHRTYLVRQLLAWQVLMLVLADVSCLLTDFKPERFGPLDGPIPNEVTESFAYLPFGGGRR